MPLQSQGIVTGRARWLLPPRCLVCAEPGFDLCPACQDTLPWNPVACARCALPLPQPAPHCGACQTAPPPQQASLAILRYESPLDRLLPRFKFHGGLAEGRLLAQLLSMRLPAPPTEGLDLLLPMPLHRGRLGARGYNQALELARPLSRAWRIALKPDALQRVRATPPQSELDADARRRNVRGAFLASEDAVRDRRVLLVDDVITTGATVREAAATLLRAGAGEVHVLALARAPLPGRA